MTKQIKICAIYGRVSTDDPFKIDHGSPEQQEHLCREMARQLSTKDVDYVVKYVLIEDRGLSGGNTKRPKFQDLCRLVDSGQVDVILSKEISRISRSTMDFCNFMDRCAKQNVAVHIKDLNVDPKTPMGGAMFKILAVVAELERELTRERTKSSLRSALVNNAKLNGGHIPLGFDPNPQAKGFWLINKEEIKQVEFLMTRFVETLSYKQTLLEAEQKGIKAKNGKPLTQDSLKSLLENEKFIGIARTTWQGEEKVVQLRHGQAISPDLFARVQDAIQKVSKDFKKRNKVHERRDNLLNGILFHEDGTLFSPTSGKGSSGLTHYYYWNAKNRIRLKAPEIEEAVIRSLRIYEEDKRITSAVDTLNAQSTSQLELVEQQIRQVKCELQIVAEEEVGLVRTLKDSGGSLHGRVGDWLNGELQKIDEKRQNLSNQLALLERNQTHLKSFQLDPKALKHSLKRLFDRFDNADVPTKRGIVRQLFSKVTVYETNKVEITWRIPNVKEENPFAMKGAWLLRTGSNRRPGD